MNLISQLLDEIDKLKSDKLVLQDTIILERKQALRSKIYLEATRRSQAALRSLQAVLVKSESDKQILQAKLVKSEAETSTLQDKLRLQDSFDSSQSDISKLQSELSSSKVTLSNAHASLRNVQDENAKLQLENFILKTECNILKNNHSLIHTSFVNLKTAFDSTLEDLRTLKCKYDVLKAKIDDENRALKTTIHELQQQLQESVINASINEGIQSDMKEKLAYLEHLQCLFMDFQEPSDNNDTILCKQLPTSKIIMRNTNPFYNNIKHEEVHLNPFLTKDLALNSDMKTHTSVCQSQKSEHSASETSQKGISQWSLIPIRHQHKARVPPPAPRSFGEAPEHLRDRVTSEHEFYVGSNF